MAVSRIRNAGGCARALTCAAWGIVLLVTGMPALAADPPDVRPLHARYDALLSAYVQGTAVDYAAWAADSADVVALASYVEGLARLDPSGWPEADALSYWINLYNAVTLRLILEHHPLDSIKDLGGFLKTSPWKRKLVTVGGRSLTLDDIENDVIRATFDEPRIHFALNCASVGCPPLQPWAYVPDRLDEQLDAACEFALSREGWVHVSGDTVRLTKIFDWYEADFASAGGVLAFVNRFRADPIPVDADVAYLPYDWSLNGVR